MTPLVADLSSWRPQGNLPISTSPLRKMVAEPGRFSPSFEVTFWSSSRGSATTAFPPRDRIPRFRSIGFHGRRATALGGLQRNDRSPARPRFAVVGCPSTGRRPRPTWRRLFVAPSCAPNVSRNLSSKLDFLGERLTTVPLVTRGRAEMTLSSTTLRALGAERPPWTGALLRNCPTYRRQHTGSRRGPNGPNLTSFGLTFICLR